jgi:putative membrane protein
MTVATLFWKKTPVALHRKQLGLPLAVYLSNFVFAAVMSIGAGIWIPVGLGILLGVAPAFDFVVDGFIRTNANSTRPT